MSVKITPLYDRVLVRRDVEPEKTAGGIYIPDTAREKSQVGEVVAVGKGKRNENGDYISPEIKVGDRVMFGKYAGNEPPRQYYEDGQELIIMREEEILGVVTGAAKGAKH